MAFAWDLLRYGSLVDAPGGSPRTERPHPQALEDLRALPLRPGPLSPGPLGLTAEPRPLGLLMSYGIVYNTWLGMRVMYQRAVSCVRLCMYVYCDLAQERETGATGPYKTLWG